MENTFIEKACRQILDAVQNGGGIQFSEDYIPSFLRELPESMASLNYPWFQEFMTHPQIKSLLVDVLNWRLLWDSAKGSDQVLLEESCNWCVQVLESTYKKGTQEVENFRSLWWDLMNYFINVRKNILYPISFFMKDGEQENLQAKIRNEIQQEFTQISPAHLSVFKHYQRALAERFRQGYVCLADEFLFNDFYIPPRLQKRAPYGFLVHSPIDLRSESKWTDLFNSEGITYVIGAPGSGKSLFLQNIINNYGKMSFMDSRKYLVILCDMKAYFSNGSDSKKSIPDFLQESMISVTGIDEGELSRAFVLNYLRLGRCLVLMDALDEVPKNQRQSLHKKIITYFKTAHPGNKVCITSRSRGFLPQKDIEVFSIPELKKEDISAYIDKMIALNRFSSQNKQAFMSQAEMLIDKHFLTSFLILSLLINIYKAEKKLPENKTSLYKKCFEYMAREREATKVADQWKVVSTIMKDSTFITLSTLAAPNNKDIPRKEIEKILLDQYQWKYADAAQAENAIEQLLDFCSNRTDLFVPASTENSFRFFHRSFFEYFYSRYILQQTEVQDIYRLIKQFDLDSEVPELTVSILKEENERKYQELILHIIGEVKREFQNSKPEVLAFGILTLAMQVIDDAFFLKEYFQIVVKYVHALTSQAAGAISQRLIALGIRRFLSEFPNQAGEFCQAYRSLYIRVVVERVVEVSKFSARLHTEYKPSVTPFTFLSNEPVYYSIPWKREEKLSLSRAEKTSFLSDISPTFPFYISAYPQPETLKQEVVNWARSDAAAFLSQFQNSKEKRKLKRCFTEFINLSVEQRGTFWQGVTRQMSENTHNYI